MNICMRQLIKNKYLLAFFLVGTGLFGLNPKITESLEEAVQHLSLEEEKEDQSSDSDTDSEADEDYSYQGLPDITIPKSMEKQECVLLFRGIHFGSRFDKQARKRVRSAPVGPLFSTAAYDYSNGDPDEKEESDAIKRGSSIRTKVKNMKARRHNFQQQYTNTMAGFLNKLGGSSDRGLYKNFEKGKNPQVSTSEELLHAGKYAAGHKFLETDVGRLRPIYSKNGKPKHPYLGQLSVVLIPKKKLLELAPYFVVYGHAHDDITVKTHFRNNILEEREVSFPGYIPGQYVLLSLPIRVPNLERPYGDWYKEKYGISKRSYRARKKILADPGETSVDTAQTLMTEVILPHMALHLAKHMKEACEEKGIKLVYKQLSGRFGPTLPSLVLANDNKRRLKALKKEEKTA